MTICFTLRFFFIKKKSVNICHTFPTTNVFKKQAGDKALGCRADSQYLLEEGRKEGGREGWREGRKPEWLPCCVHDSGASTAIGQCISTQQGAGEHFGPSVPGSQS